MFTEGLFKLIPILNNQVNRPLIFNSFIYKAKRSEVSSNIIKPIFPVTSKIHILPEISLTSMY